MAYSFSVLNSKQVKLLDDYQSNLNKVSVAQLIDTALSSGGGAAQTGTVDPSSVVTPDFIGQVYFDTLNDKAYIAFGATSADWFEFFPAVYKGPVSPKGLLTPTRLGMLYLDLGSKRWYISNGMANTDWAEITPTAVVRSTTPIGSMLPAFIGQLYIDTVSGSIWTATAIDNTKWSQVFPAVSAALPNSTFYVDVDSSVNGDGSNLSPFNAISHANAVTTDGEWDTIMIRGTATLIDVAFLPYIHYHFEGCPTLSSRTTVTTVGTYYISGTFYWDNDISANQCFHLGTAGTRVIFKDVICETIGTSGFLQLQDASAAVQIQGCQIGYNVLGHGGGGRTETQIINNNGVVSVESSWLISEDAPCIIHAGALSQMYIDETSTIRNNCNGAATLAVSDGTVVTRGTIINSSTYACVDLLGSVADLNIGVGSLIYGGGVAINKPKSATLRISPFGTDVVSEMVLTDTSNVVLGLGASGSYVAGQPGVLFPIVAGYSAIGEIVTDYVGGNNYCYTGPSAGWVVVT